MTPSRHQADELLADLATYSVGAQGLAKRYRTLIDRDRRGGTATPDGYPQTSSGGGHVGAPTIVADGERVPVTSVEAAVIARAHPPRDPVHQAATAATKALADLVNAWQRLAGNIELGENASRLHPPAEPGCWAMARIGIWEPVHVTEPLSLKDRPLGRWAYGYLLRLGRLPTPDDCRAHADGRRIMLPASEPARASASA